MQTKTRLRRLGGHMRNAPLALLGSGVVLALEIYSAGGIFQTVTAIVTVGGVRISLAAVQVAVSLGCGLLAFWGAMAAASFKSDPRKDQRRRAGGAQTLAVLISLIPIWFLGGAFAEQIEVGNAAHFRASAAYAAYARVASDPQADSRASLEAANEMRDGEAPATPSDNLGVFIAAVIGAGFVYSAVLAAAGVFWRARPESPAEANRRLQAIADAEAEAKKNAKAAKSAVTKAANKAAKQAGDKVLAFGRR